MHMLMKSFTCKASNDIVIKSKRGRKEVAVVMQIKFEINASQRIDTQQRLIINASQSLKKVLVTEYTVS